MCRAGSETLSRGPPRKNIAQGRWTFGKGLPELLTLPLPPPSTRLLLGSNLVENQKSREREREVEGISSPFQTRPHFPEETRKMERVLVNLLE